MKKLWALKVRGVRIEEKRKACFVSMKVFSSTLIGYSSFPIPKPALGQWKSNLWTFSTINASKVLIMFVLVSYFQLSFNHIILFYFDWVQLDFNKVSTMFVDYV